MKNNGFILILMLCANVAFAQTVEDDFEGNGTISTWFGDGCFIDTAYANPLKQGINTSATVLRYHDLGGQYANVRFDVPGEFDLTVHHTFTLKVYVPSGGLSGNQPNQVSLKLQDGRLGAPWATQSEIIKPIVLDQWQELTFDFLNDNYINLDPGSAPPTLRTDFNRVLIQVNGENNTDRVLAFIDDVKYDGMMNTGPVFDQLVWSDEFDGNGSIDSDKWFQQSQLPIPGSWYNGEIQHYTSRVNNAVMVDGVLKIIAQKETFTSQGYTKQYTSARLNSKFAFKYGRVEVRAKLPRGVGTWPAIWMLNQNIDENGAYWSNLGYGTTPWPDCGEIDIMEHWGDNQDFVQAAVHTRSSHGNTVNKGGRILPNASDAFHVYAVDWTPEKLVFSVDGDAYYTYNPIIKNAETWPFDSAYYLLLNVAILPNIDPSFSASAMEIDYVRVYQESTSSISETVQPVRNISIYPNPFEDRLTIEAVTPLSSSLTVRIYNIYGTSIRVFRGLDGSQPIVLDNLGYLSQGPYILELDWGRKAQRYKVIKK